MIEHVLLIDDDDDDHEIFSAAIEKISGGIRCTIISDAKMALQQLRDNTVIPDLILLDLNMPGMSGQEFLMAFKSGSGFKDIPVIIYSTTSHKPTLEHALQLGAQSYITIPSDFTLLGKTLRSIFFRV
jgi:CheY-like chemotaxis protein